MQATSTERRTSSIARMPVTMSVELGHDGWEETYDADAVNVSSSGIGVRAPMLPDVGQRLRCRFSMPDLEGLCETEGEVVWASDAGDAGEFGIRFDGLEARVEEALARWVATLEGTPEGLRATTASEAIEAKASRPHVRVQLDGVASPIDAEVALTEGRLVRVEQALPFLLLGTQATVQAGAERGARRILRSVELRVEGSVPRLVLELEAAPGDSISEASSELGESPSTLIDQPLDELLSSTSPPSERIARTSESPSARPSRHPGKGREDDSPRAIRLADHGLAGHGAHASRDALAELGVSVVEDDADQELPFLDRMREASRVVKPSLSRLAAAMRAGWAAAVASVGPRVLLLGAWLSKVAHAVRTELGARLPLLLARFKAQPIKRRTTSPPVEAAPERTGRVAGKRAEAAPEITPPERPRFPLRYALVGLALAIGVMFGVRAMSAPAVEETAVHEPTLALEAPAVVEAPAEIPAPLPEPVTALAEPAAVIAAPAVPGVSPEAGAVEPVFAGSLAPPSGAAGRLAAPTFPRVGEAPAVASAEAPLEASAETEVESEDSLPRPSGRTTFGAADVPHGRSTTLTMTLPITSLEGEVTDSGFTVNLPGVNSLSRAAPIAAANPSVERAAILNSGDHAVLTVRFVPGRTPAYRVEARGSELIVTIGR